MHAAFPRDLHEFIFYIFYTMLISYRLCIANIISMMIKEAEKIAMRNLTPRVKVRLRIDSEMENQLFLLHRLCGKQGYDECNKFS